MAPSIQSPIAEIAEAQGMPVYLGTVDCTNTSKTNSQATTAFNNTGDALAGKVLLVYNAGTVDIRIYPVATSTGVVTNTRAAAANFGVLVPVGALRSLRMGSGVGFIAAISSTGSGTDNLDVWELV